MNKVLGWSMVVVILLFLYIFVFILWRPFNNVITESNLVMSVLCEMQIECESLQNSWSCEGIDNNLNNNIPIKSWKRNVIASWSGYHGCNNSTIGFIGNYTLYLKACSCGGIM